MGAHYGYQNVQSPTSQTWQFPMIPMMSIKSTSGAQIPPKIFANSKTTFHCLCHKPVCNFMCSFYN